MTAPLPDEELRREFEAWSIGKPWMSPNYGVKDLAFLTYCAAYSRALEAAAKVADASAESWAVLIANSVGESVSEEIADGIRSLPGAQREG